MKPHRQETLSRPELEMDELRAALDSSYDTYEGWLHGQESHSLVHVPQSVPELRSAEKHWRLRFHYTGWLGIVDEDGKLVDTIHAEGSKYTWDQIAENSPLENCEQEHKGEYMVLIPAEHYRVRRDVCAVHGFSPGTCVFESTRAFLRHILGTELDFADADYFELLPYLNPDGTPTPYTAQAIQEIVTPYGLRVSRIRARPGRHLNGDIREWALYLGCNPMGVNDLRTTNAEFAATVGMDPKVADAMFGFEYHPEPLRPGIVCEASSNNKHVVPVGHASYLSPRREVGDWWLSFQIDRSPWPNPQVMPVYPQREQHYKETPDLWSIGESLRNAKPKTDLGNGVVLAGDKVPEELWPAL